MKICVLTSSRADFGIYLPLLRAFSQDPFFSVKIVAFGTHLSRFHGYSLDHIKEAGFAVNYKIDSLLLGDTPEAISSAVGLTTVRFAAFWAAHKDEFDLVFCLGDRYEMFSAVMAGVPFRVPFAHLHGGETTLGAIDNVYRHSITLASAIHFVSTQVYANRVKEIAGETAEVYNVGALGLDNVKQVQLLTTEEFRNKWGVDLDRKTILVTVHPETVALEMIEEYTEEFISALAELSKEWQILVTMPNADTAGAILRSALTRAFDASPNVYLKENLGTQSYFTAMHFAAMLLGNTSSGIIEAASFGKMVIDVGDRQKGRLKGDNIIEVPFRHDEILAAVTSVVNRNGAGQVSHNIYGNGTAAQQIVGILKKKYDRS